jgi:N-acetylglutamate synthase-like GNAT family acetyltransferase
MTTFSLRPANSADFPAIKTLVHNAHLNPTGLKWQRFVVAENDLGEVIGCGQIKPHRDGSFELASLVVAENYQGQGVARSLVTHLITNHDGNLYLMCRSSLGEFYQKFGFEPVSEPQMPPYFRRISRLASLAEFLQKEGETLLVMRKMSLKL